MSFLRHFALRVAIRVRSEASKSSMLLRRASRFTYPDKTDGNLLWIARINVARFSGLLEFSLRLGIDSSQFVLAPVDLKVGRPQLIPILLGSYRWVLGGTRVTHLPILIHTTDVEAFVSGRLVSAQRRLPIILISRVAETDTLLADSADIARRPWPKTLTRFASCLPFVIVGTALVSC